VFEALKFWRMKIRDLRFEFMKLVNPLNFRTFHAENRPAVQSDARRTSSPEHDLRVRQINQNRFGADQKQAPGDIWNASDTLTGHNYVTPGKLTPLSSLHYKCRIC